MELFKLIFDVTGLPFFTILTRHKFYLCLSDFVWAFDVSCVWFHGYPVSIIVRFGVSDTVSDEPRLFTLAGRCCCFAVA